MLVYAVLPRAGKKDGKEPGIEETVMMEEKNEMTDSFYKFETLPGKQKNYFKKACAQESNMEVRMKLIKMLVRFHVPPETSAICSSSFFVRVFLFVF